MLFSTSLLLAASFTATPGDEAIRLTAVTKGGSAKVGYYAPQRSEMAAAKPAALKKAPASLVAPMYGTLSIASGIVFVLDEPEGQPAKLYVDTNANGDLTDDPAAEWKGAEDAQKGAPPNMYSGTAMVDIGEAGKPFIVSLAMYRFDKNDPKREALKNTLLYYRDYAYEGMVPINGKPHKAVLSDEMARGDFRPKAPAADADPKPAADAKKKKESSGVTLLLDVNDNGQFDSRGESFDVAEPFNIGGTTWEIADMQRDGSSFRIVKSSKTVAEIPTPPDHAVGKTITAFEGVDQEKKAVKFPADFKGKIVLLDFWATWCGPCMKEMPNVVAAYEKFHKDGFEVLGVSLDNEESIKEMANVMKEANMTWRQVADGKFWQAEIAQLYAIRSIPATFLVDGTTGKILGTNLRGEALEAALVKALEDAKKH